MRKLLSVCLVVLFVLTSAFSALASPFPMPAASGSDAIDSESLMSGRLPVASGSDALSDEPLDESFSVIPYSSFGTIKNTVNFSNAHIYIDWLFAGGGRGTSQEKLNSDGTFSVSVPKDAVSIVRLGTYLYKTSLPSSGVYTLTYDFSSDIGFNYKSVYVASEKNYLNADSQGTHKKITFQQNSGDVRFSSVVDFGSGLYRFGVFMEPDDSTSSVVSGRKIGGKFALNLVKQDSAVPDYSTPGTGSGASTQDFQNGVTDIMGNISDKLVEIVATISDQLKALWDQMYNFMHLEQLKNDDKNTGQIVDAINNQGEQVGQDITNSIDNNTQNIINNNNQNFDNIQNGYDNTGMGADKDKLDSAINGYDKLEDDVVNQVKDNINQFEFKNPFESFTAPMKDIGYFLTGIYNALGALNIPIGFSLTLTIALLAIGWYRFKGGA